VVLFYCLQFLWTRILSHFCLRTYGHSITSRRRRHAVSTALFLLTLELETIVGNSFSFRLPPFPPREGATELQTMRRSRPSVHAESPAVVEGSKHEPDYSRLTLWAPLKTVLFRDGGVSRVLKSSCIRPYTPVFRARLPCPHKKYRVFRGTHI